jgi:hypothetical protein
MSHTQEAPQVRHDATESTHDHRRWLRAAGNGLLWLLVAAVAVFPFPWSL